MNENYWGFYLNEKTPYFSMNRYSKGANAERELIRIFWGKGFAVARTAGSGSSQLPMPDLIVLGKKRKMVLESKAWKGNYLSIREEQMLELFKWQELGGAEIFVAWKYPNKGWIFIDPKHFNKKKHYSLSYANAQRKGVPLEVLLGEQKQLKV